MRLVLDCDYLKDDVLNILISMKMNQNIFKA